MTFDTHGSHSRTKARANSGLYSAENSPLISPSESPEASPLRGPAGAGAEEIPNSDAGTRTPVRTNSDSESYAAPKIVPAWALDAEADAFFCFSTIMAEMGDVRQLSVGAAVQ